MKSVVLRLLERERGLFAGALVIAAACTALGVPFDFVLFGLTLAGVALFHHHTLQVALIGLAVILAYKLGFTGFKTGPGFGGLALHMAHEWVILTNLLGLLLGFALLSNHFEESKVPAVLPRYLPDDWKGALVLLFMIFVLSSFLDNIAAALIGGTIARTVFRGKVHIGYLAAIVAASNAGGSGSVVGDTTTTMMWIDGVDPLDVLEAFVAAGAAMFIFGIPAALQQQRYSPITRDSAAGLRIDWPRVAIVAIILVTFLLKLGFGVAHVRRQNAIGRVDHVHHVPLATLGAVDRRQHSIFLIEQRRAGQVAGRGRRIKCQVCQKPCPARSLLRQQLQLVEVAITHFRLLIPILKNRLVVAANALDLRGERQLRLVAA